MLYDSNCCCFCRPWWCCCCAGPSATPTPHREWGSRLWILSCSRKPPGMGSLPLRAPTSPFHFTILDRSSLSPSESLPRRPPVPLCVGLVYHSLVSLYGL
ncbi:hypothetical protein GQ53DRAFT_745196 [Thozetella sp. PMI_491]|nr:hypothetical protein GQ53DRAFT_745196 [Thozetella sp. PMI_491]